MAAYASVVSLLNTLDQINTHPRFSNSLNKHQIESFGEKLDFFLDFVENYNSDGSISKETLESEIASAAHEAEDVIESHIVDHIFSGSPEIITHSTCLMKVLRDMDYVKGKIMEFKEKREFNYEKPINSVPAAASSTPLTSAKMVGFDDELMQLMDVLTGQQSSRQIISIVGMGGMGKTTLTRNVYENRLIMDHFDIREWVTIPQDNSVEKIMEEILKQLGVEDGEQLHKRLFSRRYLIILDDMWSSEVWDEINFFLPDNNNRSRIVLTTRLSNVATRLCSVCIRMNFLDEHKSWDLFCNEVFGQEECPLKLVRIGKRIVEQCKGLALSISVIGGLLRNSYRTEEYWKKVARIINLVLSSRENGQCLDVLYLSYTHLPAHLKPCFLYMGTYREDCEIRISEIIQLWVAEGFLKPNGVQILEEIAEDYIQDLIDRNLILACAYHSNGKIKSCRIHDLLRELCLWISNKENFFCVVTESSIPQGMHRERRLVSPSVLPRPNIKKFFEALPSASLARSVIFERTDVPVKCRLLRVLSEASGQGIEADFQNFNLRYFKYSPCLNRKVFVPSSISLIWNMQTLIIERGQEVVAPVEIWKMRQLRHLKCSCIFIPGPPPDDEDDDSVVLGNLQTLKKVLNFRLSEEVCKRIFNTKKLSIWYYSHVEGYDDGLYENLQNLGGRLLELESLKLWCHERIPINILMNTFPSSLKKLSFGGYGHLWEDLSMSIGSLPQLEVLKLGIFSDGEWSCVEGRFLRLKFLQLYYCDLNSWTLESSSCFPVLENLVLVCLSKLNEIPSEVGDIPTLQVIRLKNCTESLAISASKIKEEAESFGNDDLLIQVEG